MTSDRPAEYLASLVRELCALPRETEWVELKVNEAEPQGIGEYISALANAAGSGNLANSAGVTILTRTSVHWADRMVAISSSSGLEKFSSQCASG